MPRGEPLPAQDADRGACGRPPPDNDPRRLQRLTRIKIPMLRGVLTVAILFRLVDLYKIVDYVFILTAGGPAGRTETLSYYGYTFFTKANWGMAATIGLFLMVVAWVTAFAYIKIFKVRW